MRRMSPDWPIEWPKSSEIATKYVRSLPLNSARFSCFAVAREDQSIARGTGEEKCSDPSKSTISSRSWCLISRRLAIGTAGTWSWKSHPSTICNANRDASAGIERISRTSASSSEELHRRRGDLSLNRFASVIVVWKSLITREKAYECNYEKIMKKLISPITKYVCWPWLEKKRERLFIDIYI